MIGEIPPIPQKPKNIQFTNKTILRSGKEKQIFGTIYYVNNG